MSNAPAAAMRRRTPKLNVRKAPGYAAVGAESRNEFYQSRKDGEQVKTIFSWVGKHPTPTWGELAFSAFLEVWGSWLIATAVGLASWFADDTVPQVDALFVGAAYAISWYAATRSGTYVYKLRRHCNASISMAYFATGEIGLFGLLYYVACKTLGTVISGLTIAGFIHGTAGSLTKLPVPLPVTPTSSFTTVVCWELFGAAIIAFFMLLNEFINTKGVSDSQAVGYDSEDNTNALRKNYRKATFRTALVTFLLVLIGYQFQVYTMSNVAYGGGLFSGITLDKDSPDLKSFHKMTNMRIADGYTNSVWTTRSGAGAFYILMPWVSGLVAAIIFMPIFYLGVRGEEDSPGWRATKARYEGRSNMNAEVSANPAAALPIPGMAGPGM